MTHESKSPAPSAAKLFVAGVAGLVAAYIFASLAFDRGSYWYYGLALAGLYLAIRYTVQGFKAKKNHE